MTKTAQPPLVSILIVTYNSQKDIEQCLNSLTKVSDPSFEVVIIDNHSTDQTVRVCHAFRTKLPVRLKKLDSNLGFAAANNLGLQWCRGEFVLLLNPDTLVKANFLQPLVKAAGRHPRVAAIQPAVYLLSQPQHLNLTGKVPHLLGFDWLRDYQSKKLPLAGPIDSISGCGVMLRRSAIELVGLFNDDYFMYYEDSDLSFRLRLAGYSLWFEPKSHLWHNYHFLPDAKNLADQRKFYYAERNRLLNLLCNYQLTTVLILLPMMGLFEVGMIFFSWRRGWWSVKLAGYLSILKLWPKLIKTRQTTQGLRKVSDRKLLASAATRIEFALFRNPLLDYVANPIVSWYWSVMKKFL